tara:strand:+ start:733 stop:1533 length:801 start_codon:yes stop_codon:yes gene_type:complete
MCIFAAPAVAGAAGAGTAASLGSAAAFSSAFTAAPLVAAPAITLPAATSIFSPAAFAAAAPAIPFAAGLSAPLVAAPSSFLGLGAAAKPFMARQALNFGTSLLSGINQRRIANQQARYAYEAARRGAEAADLAFSREVEATASRLKEERASAAQQKLTATIKGMRARAAIRATERSGLTIDLLLQDAENQAANLREAITQTMDTQVRQYSRDVQAFEAKRDSRRNQQVDLQNQAYMNAQKAPTLLDTIASAANQGLQDYTTLKALA